MITKKSWQKVFGVLLIGALCLQGCVAGKKPVSEHQTLKGDNTTAPAMRGELSLPESGFATLSDLTDTFTRDLFKEIGVKKLYLDRTKIRDANTRDVANFSTYLENEMTASLSQVFQMAYDPSEADYLTGAVFQRYGNSVRIFFKCNMPDGRLFKSLDYSIERLRLPSDSLKENLHSKAYKLAANLMPGDEEVKLYINPIRLDSCNCVTDFSRSFTTLLRTEIVRLFPGVEVCTEKPVAVSGLRGIKKMAGQVKELETSEALFSGADTVLDGEYFVNGDTVLVNITLKDLDGRINGTSSVDIDRGMIHSRLDNPTAVALTDLADKKEELGKDIVKVSTSKGSGDPVYHRGEKMVFFVQAKKPVYLYMYDITSRGEVNLLYPYTSDIPQVPLFQGKLKVLPDERDSFEFEVAPPYGMDIVKVFASPTQLPVPSFSREEESLSYPRYMRGTRVKSAYERKKIQGRLSRKSGINPDDLVDYYRGLAKQFGVELYEDSVIIETKP